MVVYYVKDHEVIAITQAFSKQKRKIKVKYKRNYSSNNKT